MKQGIWKRIAAMALCLLMLVMIMPAQSAEAVSTVNQVVVASRIKKLQTAFEGKYFTTTQSSCGNSSCTKCNAGNVLKSAWVKNVIDLVPSSFSMTHYYYGGTLKNGWSCCGFANYAGWYIFAQKASDTVKFKQYATGSYNYTTMSKAMPGDIIRLGSAAKSGSSSHSAIVVSVSSSGVKVLDCNFKHYNYVYTHTIEYSKYKYVTISRATNYDTSPVTSTVTFDPNGGTIAATSKTRKVTVGQAYGALPMPARAGFTCTGWYDAAGNRITASTKVTKTSNHTLYAHWSAIPYTVTFDPNGGTMAATSRTRKVTVGQTYGALPMPSRAGYTCIGWYDASGNRITAGTKVTKASDHTLYARWSAIPYTVTFNANGGTVGTTRRTVYVGQVYGALPMPYRAGYTCTGWYDAAGKRITAGTKVTKASNHTLYAHWTAQPKANYRALIIGENNYSNNPLRGGINNANSMAGMLRGLNNSFTTTTLTNASRSQILNGITTAFAGATDKDVSLFYYSGHGLQSNITSRLGALCPVSGDIITMSTLASELSKVKGRVIVILESCHSGAAIGKNLDDKDMAAIANAYNQAVIDAFSGYKIEASEEDVAKFGELATSKFVVITAASYDESCWEGYYDGSGYRQSRFTAAFIKGMGCTYPNGSYSGTMFADDNDDKQITLKEIYSYTYKMGLNWGSTPQYAQYYGPDNEILFRRK